MKQPNVINKANKSPNRAAIGCLKKKAKKRTAPPSEREQGIHSFLKLAADKYEIPAIRGISFNTDDRGNENPNAKQYSMCYNRNNPNLEKYCGVDWVFHHWPSANIASFERTRDAIIAASGFKPTIHKVGWFGNIYSPLPDVPEHKTRPKLKRIGDSRRDLFDIQHVAPVNGVIDPQIAKYTSLPELVKYWALLDIGGNGYSGRLKFLLFSRRPILLVERDYVEYFHNDLQPYIHYTPVDKDLANLVTQVEWMQRNPQECDKIAHNAFDYATTHFTTDRLVDRVYAVYQKLTE
jgi:hypothetical protein